MVVVVEVEGHGVVPLVVDDQEVGVVVVAAYLWQQECRFEIEPHTLASEGIVEQNHFGSDDLHSNEQLGWNPHTKFTLGSI